MFQFLKSFWKSTPPQDMAPDWTDEAWDAGQYAHSVAGTLRRAEDTSFAAAPPADDGMAGHRPAFNIDGTPMAGALDMNGNPYGVTASAAHDWSASGTGTGGDSWTNSDSWSGGDSSWSGGSEI